MSHDHQYEKTQTASGATVICECGDHASWCKCRYCAYDFAGVLQGALPTKQERRVLRMFADGRSRRQIARALTLSTKTIDTHRARVLDKLSCMNEAAAVRWLFDHGIDHARCAS